MKTEVKVITPEEAKFILEHHNKSNRPASRPNVLALANEMKKGRWTLTGETISFDIYGRLNDGQHRLMACVESGIAFESLVAYGVTPEAFGLTNSICKPRTTSDTLAIHGFKLTSQTSSIAKIILDWESLDDDNKVKTFSIRKHTKNDVTDLVLKRRNFDEAARIGNICRRLVSPSLIGACYYICSEIDKERADVFFRALLDIKKAAEIKQVLFLRDKLQTIGGGLEGRRYKPIEIMAIVFKAWNAYRINKPLKLLRWKLGAETNEMFPLPR